MKLLLTFSRGCFILIVLMCFQSCTNGTFSFITKPSPHNAYSQKLSQSGISETLAGKEWLTVAQDVLKNPQAGSIPFNTKGMIRSKEVRALAWQFDAARGATITVKVHWQNQGQGEIFVDLFFMEDKEKALLSTSTNDSTIQFEFKKTGTYIIRLQPELFAEGVFELIIKRKPTYAVFPVYGKGSKAVQSFWGAVRGGGSRKHEGIDIFARKGTPVVSPASGVVSSVRNQGLGGKQVWLRDTERGYSLYFAHLDSQAVSFGQVVKPGDTLGFVGNTGNARFTPPHLHFGIYSGGAFDPFPLVENQFDEPKSSKLPIDKPVYVVNAPKANFRTGPGTYFPVITDFAKTTPLFLLSAIDDWYHAQTPNQLRGYIHSSLLSPPSPASSGADSLIAYFSPNAREGSMKIGANDFRILGRFNEFELITASLQNFYYIRN